MSGSRSSTTGYTPPRISSAASISPAGPPPTITTPVSSAATSQPPEQLTHRGRERPRHLSGSRVPAGNLGEPATQPLGDGHARGVERIMTQIRPARQRDRVRPRDQGGRD